MSKNPLSRRRFLGMTAATASAAFAAKTILLDPEPLFASAGPAGANDRVRFGTESFTVTGMVLNRREQVSGSAVVQEENALTNTPEWGGSEFVGPCSALDYAISQPRSHMMQQ